MKKKEDVIYILTMEFLLITKENEVMAVVN